MKLNGEDACQMNTQQNMISFKSRIFKTRVS
uniref:Uncharacterized protein n=1 Tax=Arundo donax TaxID=35708 RepID=A0A0A9A1B2_ARUDO